MTTGKDASMQKTVFVTGAGGYIGRHVVRALCDAGARVLIPEHHAERVDPRAERVAVEIFSGSETIYQELGCPDACLHLAWRDGFVHSSDAHIQNLPLHYAFLRDMMKGGLKQLAVMGTMHEIGYHEGAIDENTPCNPINLYGIAKDALRRCSFLMAAKYGTCLQWLRAYYIMGDDRNNRSVFAKILAAAERGEESFPFTSGKNKFDFIDVRDLAGQIAAVLMQDEVGGIIECCSGTPVSLGERAEQFIRDNKLPIRLQYGAFPEPASESPAVWGSAEKIHEILRRRQEDEQDAEGI